MSASAAAWLPSYTRQEHAAAEAGPDLGRLREPATSPGCCEAGRRSATRCWTWRRAPEAAREASVELFVPAAQSAWLRTDPADLIGAGGRLGCSAEPGIGTESASRSDLVGPLSRPASVWGVAYVLLGSRLGGSVIAGQLRGDLRLRAVCGTAFLTSRGTDSGREWVAFRRRLDALGRGEMHLRAAGAAARWTFSWVGAVTAPVLSTGYPERPRRLDRGAVGSPA